MTSGLLNINKPYGMTSFQVVGSLKRRFNWKKAGHGGTLDPLATGVLLICIGKATRLLPFLVECRKRYRALIRLGIETATQDREGAITRVFMGKDYPSLSEVLSVLNRFIGDIDQVPPMYSALRWKGRRLYEWAREGGQVTREPRKVRIFAIDCHSYSYPFLEIEVFCGKGTYIRTLAADIGLCLRTGAHLWSLERRSIGRYSIQEALSWEEIIHMPQKEIDHHLLPAGEILSFFPVIEVSQEEKGHMMNGRPFLINNMDGNWDDRFLKCPPMVRIYDENGGFLGLAEVGEPPKPMEPVNPLSHKDALGLIEVGDPAQKDTISHIYIKPSLVLKEE